MEITIHPTSKIIEVSGAEKIKGIPARVWEGHTDTGIHVTCLITRIAVSVDEQPSVHEQFKTELQETRPPSEQVNAWPLRLIL